MRTLVKHFLNVYNNLQSQYELSSVAKHPDVIGGLRELFISNFLRNHLPNAVSYSTGEIIDKKDKRSGQIDIILHSSFLPTIKLGSDYGLFLSDTVIGVIEVKSDLTTASWENPSHLKSALDSFTKIRSLHRTEKLEDSEKSFSITHIPCVLFAFKGIKKETLGEKLESYGKYFKCSQDKYMPDIVVVLDKGYSFVRNNNFLYPKTVDDNNIFLAENRKEICLVDFFLYLSRLIEVWYSKPRFSDFNDFFTNLNDNM
ncbi:MAG: hypothetical protein MUE81_11685 [Thermoflexibacter sp.]|jgi:hypothetical protein|nr:hypothetical protein [Thermoflexibacter sp.]